MMGTYGQNPFQFSHQGRSEQTRRPVAPAVWLHTVKRSTLFRDQPDQYRDRETYFWKFPCLSCVRGIAQRWMDRPGFSDTWVGRLSAQSELRVQSRESETSSQVSIHSLGHLSILKANTGGNSNENTQVFIICLVDGSETPFRFFAAFCTSGFNVTDSFSRLIRGTIGAGVNYGPAIPSSSVIASSLSRSWWARGNRV